MKNTVISNARERSQRGNEEKRGHPERATGEVKDLNAGAKQAMNRIAFDPPDAFWSIRKPSEATDRSAKPCNE